MAVTPTPTETGKAMSLPMGMMSPMWFAFSAAASFGAAYFWMTRWAKPQNLEAMMPPAMTSPFKATTILDLIPDLEPQPLVAPPEDTAADIAFGSSVDDMPHVIAERAAQAAAAEAAELALLEPPAPEPVMEAAPEPQPVVEAVEDVVEGIEVAAAAAAAAEPATPDDLTMIVGIGPKLAAALAERGVTTFAQMAKWKARELERVDKALNLKGRAVRDAWVAQAKRFADKASAAAEA